MEDSHHSRVNVAVSRLDGLDNGVLLGFLVLPGTEAHCWDFRPGVELELRGHFGCGFWADAIDGANEQRWMQYFRWISNYRKHGILYTGEAP